MQQVSFGNLMNSIPKTSGYINSAPQWQQTPSFSPKLPAMTQDTTSFTTKAPEVEEKKKNNAKKWGILAGAALAVTVAGLIIRGRLKAVTQLAEHIDFTPAKTMEEAKEFAKKHLKIEKFDTANDLDMANWVNEGLVNINNKYKGKGHIPKEVRPVPDELKETHKNVIATMSARLGKGFYMEPILTVNVDFFNNAHKFIDKRLKDFGFKVIPRKDGCHELAMHMLPFFNKDKQLDIMLLSEKFVNGKASKMDIVALNKSFNDYYAYSHFLAENPMTIINDVYSQKGVVDLLKKHMKQGSFKSVEELGKMTNKEQVDYLFEASDALTGLPFNQHPSSKILASKRSVFDTLYHEEGHLFHHKNTILDYEDMHVVYNKQTGKPDKIGALAKGFLESKEEQFIASTVSRYAKSSPLEFVAEVYARMLNGEKFGDDVMNLYNKYKGPVLPD
ncbi:MAG: hypothetical protein V8R83_08950 [Candidatus Gastranaerophilaceae bacterium]|jgi:hypothetical protein